MTDRRTDRYKIQISKFDSTTSHWCELLSN